MICPSCEGIGVIFLPFSPKIKMLPCTRCNGLKEVPEDMKTWMKNGEILKSRRIDKKFTLRKASRFLNIDPVKLSNMERGIIEPDLNIQYYLMKVIVN
jgi:hypothetical protein